MLISIRRKIKKTEIHRHDIFNHRLPPFASKKKKKTMNASTVNECSTPLPHSQSHLPLSPQPFRHFRPCLLGMPRPKLSTWQSSKSPNTDRSWLQVVDPRS